jgi:lambda family phage minor tail protein L
VPNLNFRTEIQSLDPSALIELFTLDTTPLTTINGQTGTGSQYLWTPGTLGDAAISYGGALYNPMPVTFTHMQTTGQGKAPTPKLTVSAIGGLIVSLSIQYGDLVGAKVSRVRTMLKFLDGQPEADPSAFWGPDVFTVDQKTKHTPAELEFNLAIGFDQQGILFPRRQVIRDSCSFPYRAWDTTTAAFVYVPVDGCPYTGSACFTAEGASCAAAQDQCGKRLSDCQLRFGTNGNLPFLGFPGVALPGAGGG